MTKIITTGAPYVDVDGYAGCVGYAELLQLQGQDAVAVTTSSLNESVSNTIRSWTAQILNNFEVSENDTFVIIDISDPTSLDKIVNLDQISEIVDHHLGFEEYWQNKVGINTKIEFVGSVCTLIYEQWQQSVLIDKISETSARLMICGILDNTLNFSASVTKERDINAYDSLQKYANLPNNWSDVYFLECQTAIFDDPASSIRNDTKIVKFETFPGMIHFGQLVVWDGDKILQQHQKTITDKLSDMGKRWLINLVSINEKRSYILASDNVLEKWVESLLGTKFSKSVATTNRLWLRKEIVKQDIESKTKHPT